VREVTDEHALLSPSQTFLYWGYRSSTKGEKKFQVLVEETEYLSICPSKCLWLLLSLPPSLQGKQTNFTAIMGMGWQFSYERSGPDVRSK